MENLGPWLFATALLVSTVVLLVKIPRFRFWFSSAMGLLVLVGAVAGVYAYLNSQRESSEKLRAQSLISSRDVELAQLTLSNEGSVWRLRGTVKNRSTYPIESMSLKVVLSECPAPETCQRVGEDDANVWIQVPTNQVRAIDSYLTFSNLPPLTKWQWYYTDLVITADTN